MKSHRHPSLPLRRIGTLVGGGTPTSEEKNWNGSIPFVTPPDLRPVTGGVVMSTDRFLTEEGAASGSSVVPADSVLLSIRAPIGYVARTSMRAAFNQGCRAILPGEFVNSSYLTYALIAAGPELASLGRGTTFMELSTTQMAALELPVPSLDEQYAIAEHLDRETARIDTLIEEQQCLIDMLRERRGAAISGAVARGLNEGVALKDSGLPGAGPVPGHWEVQPLRYTISFQEGPGIMAADFREEGVPLLRVSSVRTAHATLEGCNYLDPDAVDRRWSHFRVEFGDLLISASASMGTVAEVTEETVGAVPYTGIIRIKPGRMHKDFIRWFVVSGEFIDQVDSLKTGSTIQHFGPTHLAQMRVALPPIDEQRQIAAYLDEQIAKIDTLILATERFIELARERRSALITAAVTGQIDIQEMD